MAGGEGNPETGQPVSSERRELFISYSHHDQGWLERLRVHLKPLENRYGLERWDDSRLQAGDLWRLEIEKALSRARVALLLVSPEFLASDFIHGIELPSLFRSAKQEGLRILWVHLRPSFWEIHTDIAQYQRLIPRSRALSLLSYDEQDEGMVQITKEIQAAFQQLESERLSSLEADALESHAQRVDPSEADRLRAMLEALRLEKEHFKQQAEQARLEKEQMSQRLSSKALTGPSLIQFSTTRGWIVREGNQWHKKTEPITVSGYAEELAEGILLKMIQIPAGEFQMGSPADEQERYQDEGPQHLVRLRSFFLGQTPVTQAQWKVVAGWPTLEVDLNPDPSSFKGANRPVENVSWKEAVEFCRRLSRSSKRKYTLPSEAQWEYACRGGTTTPFAFGETLSLELANYDGNYTYGTGPKGSYREETTDVGSFPANAWGLHDMHGNVWEWCLDHWHDNYRGAPADGRAWVVDGPEETSRLLRGGSWLYIPGDCRSAYRGGRRPDVRGSLVGFRLCVFPPGLPS